jgi:hypothetical protein
MMDRRAFVAALTATSLAASGRSSAHGVDRLCPCGAPRDNDDSNRDGLTIPPSLLLRVDEVIE